jgi:outer membrane autotransporter protein
MDSIGGIPGAPSPSTDLPDTLGAIQSFLDHRLQLLASHGPDRAGILRRLTGSPRDDDGAGFASGGDRDAASAFARATAGWAKAPPRAVAAPPSGVNVWVETHFSRFDADHDGANSSGTFGLVYFGADYLLTPSILVGGLVQFDSTREDMQAVGGHTQGLGAMIGPYASAKITPNVFFDARAAWGMSDNRINPFGAYEDKFSTDRWLAEAKLTGNWRFGNFRFRPGAGVTFAAERQRGYTDSLGLFITDQTISLGRLTFGPEVAYRFVDTNGMVYEPQVSIKGLWDFNRPAATSVAGFAVGSDEFRAMVESGVLARWPNGRLCVSPAPMTASAARTSMMSADASG